MPALMCEIVSIIFRYAVLPNGLLEEHVIWKTFTVAEWTQKQKRVSYKSRSAHSEGVLGRAGIAAGQVGGHRQKHRACTAQDLPTVVKFVPCSSSFPMTELISIVSKGEKIEGEHHRN